MNEYAAMDVFGWWGVQLPPEAIIHYCETHCDWSWGAVLLVYQIGDKFYVQEDDEWNPEEVSQETALQMMLDFEEIT